MDCKQPHPINNVLNKGLDVLFQPSRTSLKADILFKTYFSNSALEACWICYSVCWVFAEIFNFLDSFCWVTEFFKVFKKFRFSGFISRAEYKMSDRHQKWQNVFTLKNLWPTFKIEHITRNESSLWLSSRDNP